MIRIHLGKETSDVGERRAKLLKQIGIRPEVVSRVNKAIDRVGGFPMVALAAAVAFLPHLLIDEYKKVVVKRKEAEIQVVQNDLQNVESEIAQMEPFRKELEAFEVQKRSAREKLQTVQKLQKERTIPVNLIDAVAQSLPARTWIEELNYQDPGTINLRGSSMTNDGVSTFSQKLSESIYISDVSIQGVGGSGGAEISTKTFNMTVIGRSPSAELSTMAVTSGNTPAVGHKGIK